MRHDLGRPNSLDGQRPRRQSRSAGKRSRLWPTLLVAAVVFIATVLTIRLYDRNLKQAAPTPEPGPEQPSRIAGGVETLESVIAEEADMGPTPVTRMRYGPADPFDRVSTRLASGQTLVQSLESGGIARSEANRIVQALKPHVDFRRLRPGDHFEGTLWLGERLLEGTFYHGRLDRYQLERDADNQLIAEPDPIQLRVVTDAVEGVVKSSLFEAIYAANEKPALIMAFIDLFSWDFDFNVATRAGDRFEMLVEKRYVGNEFYDYGPIVAGRYTSGNEVYETCWYHTDSDAAGYYHTDGSSVKGAFLRAPVKYSRISSRFTLSRFHPVLKIRRPHRGIDYAASMGTPVYAVSNGYVLDARWMGGAGRAVRIKHPNGWITSYSHLSRILIRDGQRVKQGQLIGRVGSSGYSTGPHLDYRIKIGGRFVDPLKVRYPRGKSVPQDHMAAFQQQCTTQLAQLDGNSNLIATNTAE